MRALIRRMFNAVGLEVVRRPPGNRSFYPLQGAAPQTGFELDDGFHTAYEHAQERTQMAGSDNPLRRQRHYVLTHLLKNVAALRGDFCELGCWRGLSAYQTAQAIALLPSSARFHIFDSFAGLSDFSAADRTAGSRRDEAAVRRQFACSLETVRKNLAGFNFIDFHEGWIPERFPDVADRTFRWVHVDVDLYQPVKDAFDFFYPRLEPRGIMLFDDYGCAHFPGAGRAVDERLKSVPAGECLFVPLTSGQAFLVKHGAP